MASNGIACRQLTQNEQLEQVDTFPYLGSLITKDGACTTIFRTRLNGAGDRGITAENMDASRHLLTIDCRCESSPTNYRHKSV